MDVKMNVRSNGKEMDRGRTVDEAAELLLSSSEKITSAEEAQAYLLTYGIDLPFSVVRRLKAFWSDE